MSSLAFDMYPSPESEAAARAGVGRWGMVVFLLNEATLFACLVSSYFYLALSDRVWPPRGVAAPSLTLPLVMTVALLSSSGTLMYAERAFERGDRRRYRLGVALTVLLGAIFLGLQAKEYATKVHEIGPTQHAYASLFFTITGLHGTHVFFGLLVLLWALRREMVGAATVERPLAIKNASLYWHFVDGVWIVILTSLYLSPRM